MRTARLGPGARQPAAAERLHADHGTDHVAIDVNISGTRLLDELARAAEAAFARPDQLILSCESLFGYDPRVGREPGCSVDGRTVFRA